MKQRLVNIFNIDGGVGDNGILALFTEDFNRLQRDQAADIKAVVLIFNRKKNILYVLDCFIREEVEDNVIRFVRHVTVYLFPKMFLKNQSNFKYHFFSFLFEMGRCKEGKVHI